MQRRNLLKVGCATLLAPLYAVFARAAPKQGKVLAVVGRNEGGQWVTEWHCARKPAKPLPWERYFAKHNIKWSGDVRKYSAVRNDPEWEEKLEAFSNRSCTLLLVFDSFFRHKRTGQILFESVTFRVDADSVPTGKLQVGLTNVDVWVNASYCFETYKANGKYETI